MNLIISIAVCVVAVIFAFFIGNMSGLEKGHKQGVKIGYDLCRKLDKSTIEALRKENKELREKVYSKEDQ